MEPIIHLCRFAADMHVQLTSVVFTLHKHASFFEQMSNKAVTLFAAQTYMRILFNI